MKQLLCLLLVCLLTVALKAQLNGSYTSSWGFGHTSLTFNKKGEFIYDGGGCTERSKGNGKYELSGNKLRLVFQSYLGKEDSLIKIKKSYTETSGDSVTVQVKILDMGDTTNSFFLNPLLSLKDSLIGEIKPFRKNGVLGDYSYKVKKTQAKLILSMEQRRSTKTISIIPDKNSNVKIYLNDGFNRTFYNGQVIEYTVGQVNEDYMCLLKTGAKDYLKFHHETKRHKKNSKPYHEDYYCQ
jgi:hypothetical protein